MRQRLLEAVQVHALPRLQCLDLWQMAFMEPPLNFPPGVTVAYHQGKPLSAQNASPAFSSDLTHNWPDLRLQSARFPYLGFIIEGIIDWRVGITARMAKDGGKEMRRSNYMTVSMPKGTFLLMPPGVPYFEPGRNYWNRSVKRGSVLWLQFHKSGIQCFMSYASSGENVYDSPVYIADSRMLLAAEALIEELNLKNNGSREIVATLLQLCLQRLERQLEENTGQEVSADGSETPAPGGSNDIVNRACLYITAHFGHKITTDIVAAHVGVSRSHLAFLFRAAKGTSINEYLTEIRMEYICTLLISTDLRINHIGKLAGYRNPSYFCQAFQRRFACSPQEFRDRTLNKLIV